MSLATSVENMVTIVGIRFRPAGRIYYFDPQGASYTNGQYVIVETVRGVEAGRVVIASKKLAESDLSDPLKPVLRLASEDELRTLLSFKNKEKDALVQCAYHVGQHKLPMKLVDAEYTFDGSRLTFYFTADERVDFRALVRDLAATFRTRIELRQIGARDQAKLQGGVGPCGKTLCCSSWISDLGLFRLRWPRSRIYLLILRRSPVCVDVCSAASLMKMRIIFRPSSICPRLALFWIRRMDLERS